MYFIIFVIFCFILSMFWGTFKIERYPRHTSVRRHNRKGTRNGVRSHHRRISDGTRIIWVPHPNKNIHAGVEKKSSSTNITAKPISIDTQTDIQIVSTQTQVNLEAINSQAYALFSVNGKLFIFDNNKIHNSPEHVYLFTNQDHIKTEFHISVFDTESVRNVTKKFSDRFIRRYDELSGNYNFQKEETKQRNDRFAKHRIEKDKRKKYYTNGKCNKNLTSQTPNTNQNGYGSGFNQNN